MKIQEFINAARASAADTAVKDSNPAPGAVVAGEADDSGNNSHLPSNLDSEAANRIEQRRIREARQT